MDVDYKILVLGFYESGKPWTREHLFSTHWFNGSSVNLVDFYNIEVLGSAENFQNGTLDSVQSANCTQ